MNEPTSPSLETPRLTLRPFRDSDADDIVTYAADYEVARWLSEMPHPYPPDGATTYIAAARESEANGEAIKRAIEYDGRVIGSISLLLEAKHRRGYLGYCLNRDFWGHGFMTEAAAAFIEYAFAELDYVRVESSCAAANGASDRVLRKLGFVEEGLRPKRFCIVNVWHDERIFGLLREQWT